MSEIHSSAVIDPSAVIGKNVRIGPYCVIESGASIGDGCKLESHVVIKSGVRLGEENEVFEGAVIGGRPQHLQAGSRVGGVVLGARNAIRENVTIHCAMLPENNTIVGNHNMLMVGSHVAHDCVLQDNLIIANNVMLAGHVLVEHHAYLSGAVGVHQFCRVGAYAMVGGQAHVHKDVAPYLTIDGISSTVVGLNTVGLRRNGFNAEQMHQLKEAYRLVFRRGLTWNETLSALEVQFPDGPAAAFHRFLSTGKRGFLQERRTPRNAILPLPSLDAEERQPLTIHRAA